MIDSLASVEDLEARLEFPLDDEHMLKMASSALLDASVLVREYGEASWSKDTAPPIAVMLTLKAAARFMNNPMSVETARGADETNMWGASNANGVYLTPEEISLLAEHRKSRRGIVSAGTVLYSNRKATTADCRMTVPVSGYGDGSAKPFPWGCDCLDGYCARGVERGVRWR